MSVNPIISSIGSRARRAFTLVELLVVIGIIALLVSILLPALNKARESGNAVKCQANLRSIGQALMMYVGSHKGMLPYGMLINGARLPDGTNYGGESGDWSTLLLHQLRNKQGMGYSSQDTVGTSDAGRRALFVCPTVTLDSGVRGHRNHYSSHPRIMPNLNDSNKERYGSTGPTSSYPLLRLRKLTSIKRSAEIVAIFDGVTSSSSSSNIEQTWSTNCTADRIDNQGLVNRPYLIEDWEMAAASPRAATAGTPVDMSIGSAANDQYINTDDNVNWGNIRFRHLKDSSVNCLMLDGHVQAFRFDKTTKKTDMQKRNIYITRPQR